MSLHNESIFFIIQFTLIMIFICNINHKGDYDFKYLDIGFYQEKSNPLNPVITANELSDGADFNNATRGIITADHDFGELKLNAIRKVLTCLTMKMRKIQLLIR